MRISVFILLFIFINSILLAQESDSTSHDYSTLSEKDIDEIQGAALKRLGDLGDFIALLASKNISSARKDQASVEAVNLFYDDHRVIQVSSKKRKNKITLNVKEYFDRIKVLQYDKVSIKWSDLAISKKLIKGTDGKYYGNAFIIQEFSGETGDLVSYADVTKKTIEIVVEKLINGNEEIWDVRLGNVLVSETK